eukprot:3640514-Alexandrium_andersonii.AAC.1
MPTGPNSPHPWLVIGEGRRHPSAQRPDLHHGIGFRAAERTIRPLGRAGTPPVGFGSQVPDFRQRVQRPS